MECWKRQLFPIKQSEIYIEGPVQQATSVLTYTKLGPSLQHYQSKLKDWLLTIFELISWKWISQTFSTELSFSNVTKPKPASKQANKRIKNHCQPQHVKHTIDSPLQLSSSRGWQTCSGCLECAHKSNMANYGADGHGDCKLL